MGSLTASRVFCALDTGDRDQAMALARQVGPVVGGFKVGLEFFCAQGAAGVAAVRAAAEAAGNGGAGLFLDLKLHDIPNTVAGAIRSLLPLEADFLTLHAAGGAAMMRTAATAADGAVRLGLKRPRLLAVTVLTSLDNADLAAVGQDADPAAQVQRLARLAHESGVDGIVCSPAEVALVRLILPSPFVLMVPGVRPAGATLGDQKRAATPAQALAAGADYLVIGRPITAAPDPAAAARAIAHELGGD